MEKGRRRKNKNKKNNFIFWTLVLSFLFLFFPPPLFPSELALFFFNKMWAGIDHPDIIMILDVNRTWILTHRRRWKKRCRKSREMGNNLCWVCSRNCRFCGLNAWSTREGGVHGPVATKPNLFFLHKTLAGRKAARLCCMWQESLSRKEARKEGRKEMSDVQCTCVCLCVALVFSILPLY